MRLNYRRWSEHPYEGEQFPPANNSSEVGYWPMFFISRVGDHTFLDSFGQRIHWEIRNPRNIDWETELVIVEQTLYSLTPQQKQIARYWGTGEITEHISHMIFDLARKYRIGSPNIARLLGYVHASINDAFVMSWYFKYLWDVARPNQYGRNLSTVLFTPRFPAYPSAHATVAGCAEVILSYFFPRESSRLIELMEECAQSRLYAGVHFKVDNEEGLRLGRQIGKMVVQLLRQQNIYTSP
ncbi:vanadium-dependent haloperoxidase [Bacillus litorisediminis]|uniref:vanadium-dependent haloperoxidase n=1 Tax=Bacillus litorisediminis TaxID=2922713 RepID=UPI001FADC54F|nr:vanadium-dependent haloperoxidase [Bacillus litorisediminis]